MGNDTSPLPYPANAFSLPIYANVQVLEQMSAGFPFFRHDYFFRFSNDVLGQGNSWLHWS